MIRRFGERPDPSRTYTRRAGVYAVLPRASELLLTLQTAPVPELQLPGGGVDPGETLLSALHREVFEETGWRIANPYRLGVFRRFTFMPEYDMWAEKLCHIYHARPVLRLGPPSDDLHQAKWVDVKIAVQNLSNSGDRHFAMRYMTLLRRR